MLDSPIETSKNVVKTVQHSLSDCLKNPRACATEKWATFDTSSGDLLRTHYNQADVNALYGKDMRAETALVSLIRGGTVVAEVLPVVKGASVVAKTVDNIAGITDKLAAASQVAKHNLEEVVLRGADGRLEKYSYIGEGIFEAPSGGKLIATGQVDPVSGYPVFQRINSDGKLYESYLTVKTDGTQLNNIGKPEALKVQPTVSDAIDGLYDRSYLRSETMKNILSHYEALPNGDYRNIATEAVIKGPIDIGHAYGWEHRRLSLAAHELNFSRQEFNDYVNARPENFRLENMSINRSHVDEMPGNGNLNDIIDDMKKFRATGE
ncbi:hypothetical protein A1D24_12560 [Testudinibacter aquarius]|nr:hypothetical protein A1D24_12560 [Testudinibacter aquarius]